MNDDGLGINREVILGIFASIDEFFTCVDLPLSAEQRAALLQSVGHMGTHPEDAA